MVAKILTSAFVQELCEEGFFRSLTKKLLHDYVELLTQTKNFIDIEVTQKARLEQ